MGEYPDFSIDYSKVMVAKGSLKSADNASVSLNGPGNLRFNWDFDPDLDIAYKSNRAIMVAYDANQNFAIYLMDGESRGKGSGEFDVTILGHRTVHTWLSFRSSDGQFKADSVYTGMITLE